MIPKIIFIAGSGHSGSTLIDLILGSHPLVMSIGELKQMRRYVADHKECTCGCLVAECPFWVKVNTELKEMGSDFILFPDCFPLSADRVLGDRFHALRQLMRFGVLLLPRQLASKFAPWLGRDYQVVLNSVKMYGAVAKVSGKQVVVDSSKSPVVMALLSILFPADVSFIHVVRDGRAVLNSNLRKGRTTEEAIQGWLNTLRQMRLLGKSSVGPNILEVKYEDLCLEPEAVVRRICTHVGLEFCHSMFELGPEGRHNIDGNRSRYSSESGIRLDERWRTELRLDAQERFEELAGGMNRYYGYR